jgi:hypothetical protein
MSLLDEEHILNKRAEDAVNAWMVDYVNEFMTKIRFMGSVDALPKLSKDIVGGIYLLKCNDNLETYAAVSNNMGELSWQLLNSIEVCWKYEHT